MKSKIICLIALVAIFSGCSTSGTFVLPENTDLYIYERPAPYQPDQNGKVTAKPFFWSAAGGIPYRLEKDGKTIKQGRLRPKFRVVSIFWPPVALVYWPMGLNPHITYDLVNDTQE